jgi:nitroreductase
MAFKKLRFKKFTSKEMSLRSSRFLSEIKSRRTVRDFSDKDISLEIILNCIKAAAASPSGANKQPWHFVVVKDGEVKKQIRIAAEKEEKEFYTHRATKEWLQDLNQFGTDWKKPFLEIAPYLIVVFRKKYDINKSGSKKKNYYVNESVGIASGVLLTALHLSGLATLTHTPSPMGFLGDILGRPKNESAYLLIPTGFPSDSATIPNISKKAFNNVCTVV